MATTAQIGIETYLKTSYHPDCDYVDGEIEERNLGEFDHAALQAALVAYFYPNRQSWNSEFIQIVCPSAHSPMQRLNVRSKTARSPSFLRPKRSSLPG